MFSLLLFSAHLFGALNSNLVTNISHHQQIYFGFYDSSFLYKSSNEVHSTSLCYLKNKKAVCDEITNAVKASKDRYSSGDHDYIELQYCRLKGDSVLVKYELINDYSDTIKVNREIKSCFKSPYLSTK